jgi:hypothetical protein
MSFFSLNRPLHIAPGWTEPRAIVVTARDAAQLERLLNGMLSNSNLCVLAFSAAQTTATFVDEPWVSTLVLQEKVDPLLGRES